MKVSSALAPQPLGSPPTNPRLTGTCSQGRGVGKTSPPDPHKNSCFRQFSQGPLALTLSWSPPSPTQKEDGSQTREKLEFIPRFQVLQPEDSQSLPFWTQRKEGPGCKQQPSAQDPVDPRPDHLPGLASSQPEGPGDRAGNTRPAWAREKLSLGPSLEVLERAGRHRRRSWGVGASGPGPGWRSGTRSLNPISTSGGLLCLAGQAVVAVAHALFNGGEVRAVLPPVRGSRDPGGLATPPESNFSLWVGRARGSEHWGRGLLGGGAWGICVKTDSGVALWHERTDI